MTDIEEPDEMAEIDDNMGEEENEYEEGEGKEDEELSGLDSE